MTEAEWLASTDPVAMLGCISRPFTAVAPGFTANVASSRKLRLFACGVERLRMSAYNPAGAPFYKLRREALDQCEAEADGANSRPGFVTPFNGGTPAEAARIACLPNADTCSPQADKAQLLRCVFGNPWRTMRLPVTKRLVVAENVVADSDYFGPATAVVEECPWLRWNYATVPRMAWGIYDERRWRELPVLADALLDAGCDDEALLAHLRGRDTDTCLRCNATGYEGYACPYCRGTGRAPALHCRGCYVLDLILGKA